MCAPSNLQQLGLGQICLCPMNPVVQYWLTPAWKHLHHLTLRKAKLLSKGLNNECYSVLASILRETQEWEHEALIIGDHLSQPSSL